MSFTREVDNSSSKLFKRAMDESIMTKEEEVATFTKFMDADDILLLHCLKHETFSEFKSEFQTTKLVNNKKYSQGGGEWADDIIDQCLSLSKYEDTKWSKKFISLFTKRNKLLDACVRPNLRLVFSLAHQWFRNRKSSISFDDLVQEGHLGLIKAVTRFNPQLGYKFITYASWWIKHRMRVFACEDTTIRIPYNTKAQLKNINKEHGARINEFGSSDIQKVIDEQGISAETYRSSLIKVTSMDSPIVEDKTIGDIIPSDNLSPLESFEDKEILAVVSEAINFLDEREKTIICARYGIKNKEPKTLQEIGQEMNLTRERIRQLEESGFRKMKVRVLDRGSKKAKEFFSYGSRIWT